MLRTEVLTTNLILRTEVLATSLILRTEVLTTKLILRTEVLTTKLILRTEVLTTNLLRSPELAAARVARRVASGGHSIPEDVIRRRYDRGRKNLLSLYLPLCDGWMVYDSSESYPMLVAERIINRQQPIIHNSEIWNQIRE
jgi:predicted ABC-type ATPase